MTLIIVCTLFFSFKAQAEEKKSGTLPTYRLAGSTRLASDFIYRGLTMSDRNPAMNADFMFDLGSQFKLGFWGSNISNLSRTDDNFWFKFVGEINIDLQAGTNLRVYINDDHFYKSSDYNGQSLGLRGEYLLYTGQLEYMTNYQGTHNGGIYLNFGKAKYVKTDLKVGGKFGYSIQSAQNHTNYVDLKGYANYQFTINSLFEAGLTLTTESGQFGSRGNPAIYDMMELTF